MENPISQLNQQQVTLLDVEVFWEAAKITTSQIDAFSEYIMLKQKTAQANDLDTTRLSGGWSFIFALLSTYCLVSVLSVP